MKKIIKKLKNEISLLLKKIASIHKSSSSMISIKIPAPRKENKKALKLIKKLSVVHKKIQKLTIDFQKLQISKKFAKIKKSKIEKNLLSTKKKHEEISEFVETHKIRTPPIHYVHKLFKCSLVPAPPKLARSLKGSGRKDISALLELVNKE